MNKAHFTLLFFLVSTSVFATDPNKKSGAAARVEQKIIVDGKLNEVDWLKAEIFSGFTQLEPNPGISSSKESEVKVLYDDDAIYVGFYFKEANPDSILKELSARDDIGNADWCGVFIDAYKDGINGVGFIVTASGVQMDVKYSVFGEDESWNAVWHSEVSLNEDGWSAELRIPYSALRFPEQPEQLWHINFMRYRRSNREKSTWNTINPTVNGFLNQSGYLKGIKGITPPLRLQLFPYLSSYYNIQGKDQFKSINGGMDVKYGLSDAFTLDMTLVPDFGQVQSDNQVLNLSPFEVRFQENRQFFTEGTELFNKGDLFYSRRIGQRPINYGKPYGNLKDGEEVLENPSVSRLVNASKISGRMQSGLGVGVFNAVTRNTFATIRNAEGETREELTDPATNYNVLVLDQNLKNNSYVTLINTNVTRDGQYNDANVTGTQFTLQDKTVTYQVNGFAAVSQKFNSGLGMPNKFGNTQSLNFAKVSGNFTLNTGYSLTTDRYDPNDLGFLFYNNTIEKNLSLGYNIYKPFAIFNRAGFGAGIYHTQIYNPRAFNSLSVNGNAFFIFKSFNAIGMSFNSEPTEKYDYFETRTYGRYYITPINNNYNAWFSTDYRKKLAFDVSASIRKFDEKGRNRLNMSFSPRFRANNKLSFVYSWSLSLWSKDVGYAVPNSLWYDDLNSGNLVYPSDQIIFGVRDQQTYTNLFTSRYSFNNKMGITFRLRHYWSKVNYEEVYQLTEDGKLAATTYTGKDDLNRSYHNSSYNAFNIDMVYSWVFSPGSELRLVWKNSIYAADNRADRLFADNLNYVLDQSQTNSFSVKFLYFIDFGMFKKRES